MNNNKKMLAVLSVPAIASLLAVAVTTPVKAANRDFYDESTTPYTVFQNSTLASNPDQLNKLIDASIDHPAKLVYEFSGKYYNYDSLYNSYVAAKTANPSATTSQNFTSALAVATQAQDPHIDTTKFAVASLNPVDNLKTVTINFTKPVDKTTLTTSTVKAYLNGSASTSTYTQELSADGKSLTLAFNGLNQSDSMKISLTSVKDTSGDVLDDYSTTVTFIDRTSPVVNNVKVLNNKKFDIYFSEPVNMDTVGVYKTTDASSTGLLTIDGGLTFAKYTAVPTENKVTVELFSELADGSHTIDISKVKDFAGFNIDEKSFTINTTKDVTAPKATAVTYTSASTVEVTFDEDLSNDGTSSSPVPGTFELYEAGVAEDPSIAGNNKVTGTAFKLNSDGTADYKTVVLTTSPLTVAATVGFDVKYKNVADVFGNKTADYTTISGKATDNTTKPTVASYAVEDQNAIKLAFSEKVATPAPANLVLYKADGTTVVPGTPTIANYDTTNPDGKTFKITFPGLATVDSDGYKLKVTGVKDSSIRSNVMDDVVLNLVTKDTNPPKLLANKAEADATTGNKYDTVTLVFSEAMDSSAAGNISNYFVQRTSDSAVLPVNTISGAKVQSVSADGKRVVLVIPSLFARDSAGNATTTLNYNKIAMPTLKDVAGNLISNAILSSQANIDTNYAPLTSSEIDTVEATGTKTVVVKLKNSSSYTFASADPQAVSILNGVGGTLPVIGAQISQDGKTMTITTGTPMTEDAKLSGSPLSVKIDSTSSYAVKDQNGSNVVGLVHAISDKIAPSVTSATYTVDGGAAVALAKSSDGKTFTADLSGKASTDVFSLSTITLGDPTARIQFATPYINGVTGGYKTPTALKSDFDSITGSGITLSTLQTLAAQDADGDDSTLTITGQVSDDANGDTIFGDTNNDNVSNITIKIKVK